jgi:hypothetical protein
MPGIADQLPSWQTVRTCFTERDVTCMTTRGHRLDEYESVKADAETIYESVTSLTEVVL